LWFSDSSQGNFSLDQAFDPQNFGLAIPVQGGRLVVDLSEHFIYDTQVALMPIPNVYVELGLAMGNALLGGAGCFNDVGDFASIVCANWTAEFGANVNQIVFAPQNETGLIGDRGTMIGAKFAHIHPAIPGVPAGITLYHNANGTCSDTDSDVLEGSYCRFDTDCPNNVTCVQSPALSATVTATVYDSNDQILHKATQQLAFAQEPLYHVYATNWALTNNRELTETVDFQRVLPRTQCLNVSKAQSSDFFSQAAPYAPRFLLFAPGPSDTAFPHPIVPNVTVSVINPTKADLLSNDNPIGLIELIQPDQVENPEDGAIFIGDGAGFVRDGGPLGGSVFVVPIEAGSVLGVYTVRVTMLDGAVAESRTVVVESIVPTGAPTLLPTHSPTTVPTNGPTSFPTQLPTTNPTLRPTAVPTNGPTSVPTQSPTYGPTEVSAIGKVLGAAAAVLLGACIYTRSARLPRPFPSDAKDILGRPFDYSP
jgi:hypothetical protein